MGKNNKRCIKNYPCGECTKKFKIPSHLKTHYLHVHAKDVERPFDCLFCERRFASRPISFRHLTTHLRERPHFCGKCSGSFISAGNLKRHLQDHPDVKLGPLGQKRYYCKECDYVGKTISILRRHLQEKHKKEVFRV
ncbi:hypothetical protein Ocin01_15733 [Orchesella cincta]|uniref:C2H2-type domain-containing protein n=1 Tax=Orchesella cincta TaxID=48709 RepID=A0A1D2MDC1_ORCCI|nr:hypothetical protein Ocin01_15733 [Orchesella cincta]